MARKWLLASDRSAWPGPGPWSRGPEEAGNCGLALRPGALSHQGSNREGGGRGGAWGSAFLVSSCCCCCCEGCSPGPPCPLPWPVQARDRHPERGHPSLSPATAPGMTERALSTCRQCCFPAVTRGRADESRGGLGAGDSRPCRRGHGRPRLTSAAGLLLSLSAFLSNSSCFSLTRRRCLRFLPGALSLQLCPVLPPGSLHPPVDPDAAGARLHRPSLSLVCLSCVKSVSAVWMLLYFQSFYGLALHLVLKST